jgi:UDP-2,4-diacetamido-2,4,6-trideoxy-beta-L-altropyranose hydrolase
MRVVFRTDASLQIGTGHVMRCLTLADELKAAGAQCHFICREHPGNLIAQIQHSGFSVSVLPVATKSLIRDDLAYQARLNYDGWLGADWATDAAQTKVCVGDTAADWLIVDHYALDLRWEQTLRPICRRLMVIDDLADRSHDCDLLLDQNLGREVGSYRQLVNENCTILVGPHYALLRPEFSAHRLQSLERRAHMPHLQHLLITMGGTDKDNSTGRVLEALKACKLPAGLNITVVMGLQAPWLAQVQGQAADLNWPTQVLVGVSNMAQLIAASDLAIGAAGITAWERCCLGLPSIILVLADNQQMGACALQDAGAAVVVNMNQNIPDELCEWLLAVATVTALTKMSNAAAAVTDGEGCVRVAAQMMERFCA